MLDKNKLPCIECKLQKMCKYKEALIAGITYISDHLEAPMIHINVNCEFYEKDSRHKHLL